MPRARALARLPRDSNGFSFKQKSPADTRRVGVRATEWKDGRSVFASRVMTTEGPALLDPP